MVSVAAVALLLITPVAHAQSVSQSVSQPVERNSARQPQPQLVRPASPPVDTPETDLTPLGVPLRHIALIGGDEPLPAAGATAITSAAALRISGDAAIARALDPLLGQPPSLALISRAAAAITERYRALGYPLVSVSTPEQDISTGRLVFRVMEFRVGRVLTQGARAGEDAALRDRIGLAPGDAVAIGTLTEDVTWLNRYPFRQAQLLFQPGAQRGETDLVLALTNSRPWQVYGGYSNAGSRKTKENRNYLGVTLGNVFVPDGLLSAQVTASDDVWLDRRPRYLSHALSYTAPVARHGQIELTLDRVETRQPLVPFLTKFQAEEAYLVYRTSLGGPVSGRGLSDLRVGVEAKRAIATTAFFDTNVFTAKLDIYQLVAGYHYASPTFDLDLAVHGSPGGIGPGQTSARARRFSQNAIDELTYAYLTYASTFTRPLGGNVFFKNQLAAQIAGEALPLTEKAALGGPQLVRGYDLDDGAYDLTLITRNELRLPTREVGEFNLSPFVFLDIGHGRDLAQRTYTTFISKGLGLEVRATPRFAANFAVARSEKRGPSTPAQNNRILASISLSY